MKVDLTHSFEDLVQTYRVLIEAFLSCKQLISVDRYEAVGTLETAINANLNAFHNLYDLIKESSGKSVDWYSEPQLLVVLAIRNARHHNHANRIRSLYNFHAQTCKNPTDQKAYFYVDFPANPDEVGGDFIDIPLSWGDLDCLLSLPKAQSRLRAEAKGIVREYLNADYFEAEAENCNIDRGSVFVNFLPLVANAAIFLHPHIKDQVTLNSVEAKFFSDYFGSVGPALTQQHEYEKFEFSLPQ